MSDGAARPGERPDEPGTLPPRIRRLLPQPPRTGSRARLRFATEVLLLQLVVVVAVVVVCTAAFVWMTGLQLVREAESSALAIARTLAADPSIRSDTAALSQGSSVFDADELENGPIQLAAEDVREKTGALFVVVTDDRGFRLAHPDPGQLGEMVSTSPDAALRGEEVVTWETGTLGESARAKVPIRAPFDPTDYCLQADLCSPVVGEVSVGFARASVYAGVTENTAPIIGAGVVALLIGVAASVLIRRRLQRATLGLQPEQLRTLVQDQEAVLGGVGEGVLGLAPTGTVTVCNERAATLLGLETSPLGRAATDLPLPERLAAAIVGPPMDGASIVVGSRILFVDVREVVHDGHDLGRVVIVRDRTDVEALSRRLDAVGAMTTALRVQRHEFANRLHTISGLLATGETEEARGYLAGILELGPLSYPVENAGLITEPYLQAFVGAKGIEAGERGVRMRVGPETLVTGLLTRPDDVTTVLGNLLDNAVRAAVEGSAEPRFVEVEFVEDGADLIISVLDSGDGIRAAASADPGAAAAVSGAAAPAAAASGAPASGSASSAPLPEPATDDDLHGHGFGLPLSREIAERDGGRLWLASPGAPGEHGAVFCARLVGVVAPRAGSSPLAMTEGLL